MTPFEIDITRLDGRKILKEKKGFLYFFQKFRFLMKIKKLSEF
ncbi:MAG: hypothetical protein CM15mP22_0500 [Gammaproteobacteria bacterium]|nr:MAG: hypothetical protein CM15mP22_0500 [Gammaproteobacteria bacterium]